MVKPDLKCSTFIHKKVKHAVITFPLLKHWQVSTKSKLKSYYGVPPFKNDNILT